MLRDIVFAKVSLEGFAAYVVKRDGPRVVFDVGALVNVGAELGVNGFVEFLFHLVHVDLGVADLDGVIDRDEPTL